MIILDRDTAMLQRLQHSKRERPHIAKLLSRKDLDNFELDVLMSTDEQNIKDFEGFDFESYEDFE